MGLFRGKSAINRVYVREFKDANDAKMRAFLQPRCIQPLTQEDSHDTECGWCTLQGGADLEAQSLFLKDYFVFGFRVDAKKIDASALRRAVKENIAAHMEEHGLKKIAKATKTAIADDTRQEIVKAAFPSTKVYSVAVDSRNGMLYTDAPAGPILDLLVNRLGELEIDAVTYGNAEYGTTPRLCEARLQELSIVPVENDRQNTMSEFFRVCASLALKRSLFEGDTQVFMGDKATFTGDQGIGLKSCALKSKEGMSEIPEFVMGLRKGRAMSSIALASYFGDVPWSVEIDDKMRFKFNLPNPEAAEFDDLIALRMECVEKAFNVVDRLYMKYYNEYVGRASELSAEL